MTLQRKSDGERLAVAETEIRFLTRGDEELKAAVEEVKTEMGELRDEMRMGFADITKRLDAQSNQFVGASKLAILLMKAWPIAVTALGTFFITDQLK